MRESLLTCWAILGIGFASKKAGYNVDRNTEEKIGDGMRGAYEKFSG